MFTTGFWERDVEASRVTGGPAPYVRRKAHTLSATTVLAFGFCRVSNPSHTAPPHPRLSSPAAARGFPGFDADEEVDTLSTQPYVESGTSRSVVGGLVV